MAFLKNNSVAHHYVEMKHQNFNPQPFRDLMEGQGYSPVSTHKKTAYGAKNHFLSDFFLLHITASKRDYFVFTKTSYLISFKRLHGGDEKSVTNNSEQ